METKIIDGKEYTKVGIKEFNINGEKKENSFSLNDVNGQGEIYFDIKVDYNADENPTSFTTSSLNNNNNNIKLDSFMKISSEPVVKNPVDTSHNIDTSASNEDTSPAKHKINYWYYVLCAIGLVGFFYFLFIK